MTENYPGEIGDMVGRAGEEMMGTIGSATLASRMTGEVRRYHAWRINHEQSVADHTWHVIRLYITLFGLPSEFVLCALQFHDVGELLSSDLQFPIKKYVPVLKEVCDHADGVVANFIGINVPPLEQDDKWRVKACDYLEMYETGTRELMSGNRGTGEPVRRRIHAALEKHMNEGMMMEAVLSTEILAVGKHIREIDKWLKLT